MKPSFVVVGALAVVVVVGAECKRTNGAYCDDARPCPNGFACDLTARECHSLVGGGFDLAGLSTDMAGCRCSGPTPICVAMTCVSCMSTSDPDGACKAASQSTPHCASDGSCVGCRDASDCSGATPFCDMGTHQCRGCVADGECTSLVCDLIPSSTTHGTCIPPTQVEYVDCTAASNGTGLTIGSPRQKLQDGVNHSLTDSRPYVHVAAGTCSEFVAITGAVTVNIVGAEGAILRSTMNGKDALGVQNNASLTVRNMIVTATMGANAGNCSGGGISLKAYRTQFINSAQLGVYSMGCALLLDGCTVSGNAQGGINIGSGDFTIINTVIAKNMAAGMYQTVAGANTIFVNNTVADNSVGAGEAGIHCVVSGSFTPVNTILYNNRGAGSVLSETNCMGAFMATDDVTAGPASTVDLTMQAPGFVGGGDYHLMPTSPCVDHGTNTMGAPNHDFDFAPRPDATKMLWDIGAAEVQK